MNKTLSFAKLDFLTIRPYLTIKNTLLFVAIAFVIIWASPETGQSMGLAFIMMLSLTYSGYPFSIGEKSNMDVLYSSLSIKRRTVVLGRYLFAILTILCATLIGLVVSFIPALFLGRELSIIQLLLTTLALFFVFSIAQAVQLPMFFKLGYTKAKLFTFIPFLLVPVIAIAYGAITSISGGDDRPAFLLHRLVYVAKWLTTHSAISFLLTAVLWLGIMAISYRVALGHYRKRDF